MKKMIINEGLYYGKESIVEDSNKKKKDKRYHVDLAPEMGKDFSDIADKMGLTLSAVVKMFLMQPWMKYQYNGFDYIYLGVADKPENTIPYVGQ